MSQKIIHRFEIDGHTVKRESATRRYRFVAVSQYTQADKDRDIEYAKRSLDSAERDLADGDSLVKRATEWFERGWTQGRSLDEEIAFQRKNAQVAVERRRKGVTEAEAKPTGTWRAEGWSKTRAGAQKAADTARKRWQCSHVEVHEVTDVVEREVKKRGRNSKPGRVTAKQLELLRKIDALGDEAYFGCVWGRVVPNLYRNGLLEDGEKVFLPNKTGTGGRHTHRLIITAKGRAALKGSK